MNISHFANMDSDSDSDAGVEESSQILYDIVTYKEWEQDPEVVKNFDRHNSRLGKVWLGPPSPPVLPPTVEKLGSALLPWHLAVSPDASLIAVLGDAVLEVWSSRENYSQLVGRRGLERDMAPQWRHLVWTADCSLLTVASSSGAVEVCDTVGNQVYQLISPRIPASQSGWADSIRSGPVSASYAGVFFTEARVRDKLWVSELVLVDFAGQINSFYVSLTGYQEMSSYSLGWSVTAATFCSCHSLLLTAGGPDHPLTGKSRLVGRASHAGIVALRLLNDSPHYVELLDAEEQSVLTSRAWLPALPFISSTPIQDFITKLSISSCGSRLAVLHQSGTLSVWLIPSLVLESSTRLEEQPLHDECNPQLLQAPERRRAKGEFLSNPLKYHPVGVAWWNSESVVLARMSGALTVLGVQDLTNMLGDSPEFLEGVPRISQCFQKGFFGLECDSVVRGRRPSCREESAGEDPDVELEVESDDDDDNWLSLGKRSAAALAYYVTDSERFAPPKKKAKIVRRTYRLLALVSTSPEELFNRKILLEEYGEAIMLAQHYGLDTDPVYSRQWQQSKKSMASIHDYLAKMKKRGEVIRECLDTIPEDIDAARELLQYGLRATDLEALIALGGEEGDTGELVLADIQRVMDDVDTVEEKEQLERRERLRLVAKVRWESLSLVQKDLISTRLKLLYYLDCLHTLEDILGGGQRASDRFSASQYSSLRSHNPLENCVRAARQGDSTTVLALLGGRHASHTAQHWLAVLAAFPETVQPGEYKELLPCVGEEGVEQLFRHDPREQDWCEGALAVKWGGPRPVWDPALLYKDQPDMKQYCTEHLTASMVSTWYSVRARQVVQVTSLPDMGLELLNLGLERGATVHWELLHNLRTLDCLVYEIQEEVELDKLEKMDCIQQMDLLLAKHSSVVGVRRFLQPFLQRLEDNRPGEMRKLVHQLCVARAVTDLTFPLVVVEHSGPDKTGPVLYSVVDTIRLALDCCYANTSGAQVETAEKIYLSVLPYFKENPGTRQLKYNISHMRQEVEMFKQHLEISRTLLKNGVIKPLAHIKDNMDNPVVMKKLFDGVTARAEGARPPLEQDGWRAVLRDLQLLQSLIPCVSMETVILSYTESLLSSGSSSNIDLAGTVLEGVVESGDTLQLLLTAWRHYYTSSSGVGDPELDLARQCLALAQDGSREVQDCYDLIAALQSLADFGLGGVLPVTVLECKDRMEFVRQAVQARPTAYKNSQRLMKLASLLRVNGGESVEGMVWATIARRALDVGDHSTSQTACNNFMLAGYTAGWDICYALAARGDFTDLDKCSQLLAFAVSHCQRENIADIMQTIVTVEQKNLTSKLSSKIETGKNMFENGIEEDEDIFDDAVEETESRSSREVSPMNTVLNIPSLSSQFLLQHQVTAGVLQQTSSWLSQLSAATMERSFCEDQVVDMDFTSVRVPAFYSSLFPPDTPLSALDLSYTKFSRPVLSQDLGVASYQIFRISCLSETILALSDKNLDTSIASFPNMSPELLQQLVPLLASQDLFLGLALLVSVPPSTSLPIMQTLPRTLPSLCLTLTHLSTLLLTEQQDLAHQIFSCSPEHLVQSALNLQSSSSSPISTELISYLELATDFHQGNQLSGLAGQVDVERFTSDYQYKEDTILGLAMFTEQDKWDLTLTLAKRYALPLWVVSATHLETILTSPLPSSEAKQLVSERDLVSTLESDPDRLDDWMTSKVLPLLDGLDTERLLVCYSILEEVGSTRHKKHVEALNIIKVKGIKIDYRLLEEGSEDVFELLREDNVETIAQLVDILGNDLLTASKVYHSWAFKAFLKHGESKDNWIEAFSVCHKFMEKMETGDFQSFVKNCILSTKSINMVPRPARGRIFKKAVKFVEVKIAAKAEGDWDGVEGWLQKVKTHSDRLKQPLSIDVISKLDEKHSHWFDEFEMTGGDEIEIMKLIAGLILQNNNINVIKSLVQVWKQEIESCIAGLLEILQAVIDQILEVGQDISKEPFKLLENLFRYYDLPAKDLSELISPLCTNEAVPVHHRLTLIKLVKELNVEVGSESDLDSSVLAALYETQHDIQTILPGISVEKSDLENNNSRWQLYERIVSSCNTTKQLLDFYLLVQKWEGFEEEALDNVDKNCILVIVYRMFKLDKEGKDLIKLLANVDDVKIPSNISQLLISHCEEVGPTMLVVKVVLQLRLEEKYEEVLEILFDQTSCDHECLGLLVSRGLVSRLVTTPLYHQLVQMVVEEEESVNMQVVEQLTKGGHKPQAMSLQMMLEGVPAGLRTMAAVVQRLRSGNNNK